MPHRRRRRRRTAPAARAGHAMRLRHGRGRCGDSPASRRPGGLPAGQARWDGRRRRSTSGTPDRCKHVCRRAPDASRTVVAGLQALRQAGRQRTRDAVGDGGADTAAATGRCVARGRLWPPPQVRTRGEQLRLRRCETARAAKRGLVSREWEGSVGRGWNAGPGRWRWRFWLRRCMGACVRGWVGAARTRVWRRTCGTCEPRTAGGTSLTMVASVKRSSPGARAHPDRLPSCARSRGR